MNTPETIARQLAISLTGGTWTISDLVERGTRLLGRDYPWLSGLARRLASAFPGRARPGRRDVTKFLLHDEVLQRACRRHRLRLRMAVDKPPEMYPTSGPPSTWRVPALVTTAELAVWLESTPERLDWLADRHDTLRRMHNEHLSHYHYRWLKKRVGGSARLIEAPKWRLKTMQRKILHGILDGIPPHDSAHGFRPERSIQSYVAPHIGRSVVIRTDLRDFFPSVTCGRILGLFQTAGYPDEVAALLAALCTNRVPDAVWHEFPQYGPNADRRYHEHLYERPHLPQGAPTSPALANLVAFRLDCRLSGLAVAAGAHYTRYADDLLFSGDSAFAGMAPRFLTHAESIVMEEGFTVNSRKTRIMRQAQRQTAAGLTINQHMNIPRDEYDRLKAALYNLATHGLADHNVADSQQLHAHLAGRVAYVESINPHRGQRLRALFQQITW